MKLPFNNASSGNTPNASYFQAAIDAVEKKLEEIRKNPNRSERIADLEAMSKDLHTIYNDGKPLQADKKAIGAGALTGTAVLGTLTGAAGMVIFPWLSIPAMAVWMATHVGIGTAVGGGAGSWWGKQKEKKRLSEKYGSVEIAQNLHQIVTLVDSELERQRLENIVSPSTKTKAGENFKEATTPAPERQQRELGNYDHLTKLNERGRPQPGK